MIWRKSLPVIHEIEFVHPLNKITLITTITESFTVLMQLFYRFNNTLKKY
jgi:hypothetical protein